MHSNYVHILIVTNNSVLWTHATFILNTTKNIHIMFDLFKVNVICQMSKWIYRQGCISTTSFFFLKKRSLIIKI